MVILPKPPPRANIESCLELVSSVALGLPNSELPAAFQELFLKVRLADYYNDWWWYLGQVAKALAVPRNKLVNSRSPADVRRTIRDRYRLFANTTASPELIGFDACIKCLKPIGETSHDTTKCCERRIHRECSGTHRVPILLSPVAYPELLCL